MSDIRPSLLWFRQDLRLSDNSALAAAVESGRPVIPVYILECEAEQNWPPGAASRWWLHHSLAALDADLRRAGSQLSVYRGESEAILKALVRETGATQLYWNRRYEPAIVERDRQIEERFKKSGIAIETFNSSLLFEPKALQNRQGGPFQVFSPFWRALLSEEVSSPVKVRLAALASPKIWPRSLALEELKLLPQLNWADAFPQIWRPGEQGGQERLRRFQKTAAAYAERRDEPAQDASSRLSPHLHFGEVGPRQVWAAIKALSGETGIFPAHGGAQKFLAELGWREFAYHLLHHFPNTPDQPLRKAFADFPWARDPQDQFLHAWQRGRTGFPIVDAGMRELWTTGWMPNRLRMITASFLVKDLLVDWRKGARWFWDTLVDADLANNTLGWQWVAGCGADASPFFRIFSPELQGKKFDPKGEYVRRWIPELAGLPDQYLHSPWEAPAEILKTADVQLGETYPTPLVNHDAARVLALAAYRELTKK